MKVLLIGTQGQLARSLLEAACPEDMQIIAAGRPQLDLTDRAASQVWRFEMRLGSKQLRNRFEMRNWQDVHNIIGDAFTDALGRIRYCMPTADRNRARWPTHDLWQQVASVIAIAADRNGFESGRSGANAKGYGTFRQRVAECTDRECIVIR